MDDLVTGILSTSVIVGFGAGALVSWVAFLLKKMRQAGLGDEVSLPGE